MTYGEIQIIGEQVFFDKVAVATLRSDALHGLKEDFKAKILKSNQLEEEIRSIKENSSDSKYDDDAYYNGHSDGHDEGYNEGYSDALANKPLDGK